jgi:threonine synthase
LVVIFVRRSGSAHFVPKSMIPDRFPVNERFATKGFASSARYDSETLAAFIRSSNRQAAGRFVADRSDAAFLECIDPTCGMRVGVECVAFQCAACGGLLDVRYDWSRLSIPKSLKEFEAKWRDRRDPLAFSGVWRFRELLPFAPSESVVTIGEGQTLLQPSDRVARYVDVESGRLLLQYEGLNPSGSFKDNGMTAAFTHARMVGAKKAACASTGNTSASLALYCSASAAMKSVVFVGSGKIAYGKLAQALDHGALTVQIEGDFDDAMARVREAANQLGIYVVNSINAFRLEGQKTIIYRVLEALDWEAPDWIVVPGGNLGNTSAFGKALAELKELGLLDRSPRLASINAAGANTLYRLYEQDGVRWNGGHWDREKVDGLYQEMDANRLRASTLASAIEINRPVNLPKALRALELCDGVVRAVTDQDILDAKAIIGAGGLGCEPASAASVAGARLLRKEGVIAPSDRVVCILTGHLLKDPTVPAAYHGADRELFDKELGSRGVRRASFANRPVKVPNDLADILHAIELNTRDESPRTH